MFALQFFQNKLVSVTITLFYSSIARQIVDTSSMIENTAGPSPLIKTALDSRDKQRNQVLMSQGPFLSSMGADEHFGMLPPNKVLPYDYRRPTLLLAEIRETHVMLGILQD